MSPKKASESGNVIFFILIGVALFAALTMAITETNKGGGDSIDDEQARVRATEIMEYGSDMATAISRLRLNGCSQTQISFENHTAGGYENAFAPSDESCHVFSLNGGGMRYQPYDNMIITGNYVITHIKSDDTDLILDLQTTKNTCEAINELLGIPNNGIDGPPTDTLDAGVKFDGDYVLASTAFANQRTENAE